MQASLFDPTVRKILVTGSRHWTWVDPVLRHLYEILRASEEPVRLVHGAGPGADRIAAEIGFVIGYEVVQYPAEWERYGRSAGPLRNQRMINAEHSRESPIDLCLAMPTYDSVGTFDMIHRCERYGIRVMEVSVPVVFTTPKTALASLQRSEFQLCRVVRGAKFVIVQTPEGMGKFSTEDWIKVVGGDGRVKV